MRWTLKTVDEAQSDLLAAQLRDLPELRLKNPKLTSTLARLLTMRGITDAETAERFLSPSLDHLHSPYTMLGMKTAVERIDAAIEKKEGILIYGDYDVDGTTAVVILKTAIELCGGAADFHVPHRIKEGYDLRGDVIERSAAAGIRLVISVDAGIRAFAAAETARRVGVDLIVTDHHLPGPDGMPHALAVLNPNQPNCDYPCKALCGAGVAFKLAQALMEKRLAHRDQAPLLKSFSKIAAIATVADSVPLTGENRVFAKLGLDALRTAKNPGLKALLDVAQLGGRPLSSGEVAFRVAPRINAAGRMDIAADVIELFSTKDESQAKLLAGKLDRLNAERQKEERRILESINKRLEEEPALRDAYCIVLDGEGWHRGVVGITATRVVERYHRPAIVISCDGDQAHGSGRSIRPFHLLNALESCPELFTRYGGHSHAVGFSMPAAQVPELRKRLDAYAHNCLTASDLEPVIELDAMVPFDHITPDLFQALQRMEPFGVGNREPIFAANEVRVTASPRIMKEKHAKLKLAFNGQVEGEKWRRSITYDALGWHMAEEVQQAALSPGDVLDIAFILESNDHSDFGGLELTLRDFKVAQKTTVESQSDQLLVSGSPDA